MDVILLSLCRKELEHFPEDVRAELLDAIANLRLGLNLSMPLSRPMPSVGKGVHELRFKDRAGEFRVIYLIKKGAAIYLVHAFKKTTQQTSLKNLQNVARRIRAL